MRRSFFVLFLATTLAAGLGGQEQQPPSRTDKHYVSGATAILVDVIVRDRDGHPVTDLSTGDFELYEDGQRQEIGSLTLVSAGGVQAPVRPEQERAGEVVPPALIQPPAPSLVAMVFERLSPEGRSLATRAALTYLAELTRPEDRVGVFAVDVSLHTLQGFTGDIPSVQRAVQRLSAQGAAAAGAVQEGRGVRNDAEGGTGTPPAGTGAGAAAAAQQASAGAADQLLAEMQQRMDESYRALERDQEGYATANGLLAIVNALRGVKGRKTVILFSEGLSLPPAVQHHFDSVIAAANRTNTAVYTVDASGLRAQTSLDEARNEIAAAASSRRRQLGTNSQSTGRAMSQMFERNEDLLASNPEQSLAMLADATGGFLIGHTNSLRRGLERVDSDRRSYYLLTYVPRQAVLDGKFRSIDVKVNRPAVVVRARKGYVAVPDAGVVPVLAYEAPAIAMLERTPVPNAFAVRAAALSFPTRQQPGLSPILVELKAGALSFQVDQEKNSYVAEFTILVRLKDTRGEVVRKMSQEYRLSGPLTEVEAVKQQDVLFYRQPELEPALYAMETIVYDALAEKASVRLSTVDRTHLVRDGLQASSLVLLKRSERVPAGERQPGNPLYYGDLLLYPNLGSPIRLADQKELAFYVAVDAPGPRESLNATIELLRQGRVIGQSTIAMEPAGEPGRHVHVGRLPIDQLTPGDYELRFSVQDGKLRHVRSAPFVLVG